MKESISSVFKPQKPLRNSNKDKQKSCKTQKKTSAAINERYVIKFFMYGAKNYKVYKGIDLVEKKYVTIYLKPASKERFQKKKIPEDLIKKITPQQKAFFTTNIEDKPFDIEIHERYGPSLEIIRSRYRKRIEDKTFFKLAYQLYLIKLKLLSKIDSEGFIIRNLNPQIIICHQDPEKTDLFLLDIFDLERKNQELPPIKSKYSSLGANLGLKTCSKDTFESMCYILIDFYMQGKLFSEFKNDFEKAKTFFQPTNIPVNFITFFYYIKNLNPQDQIKFTEWKNQFRKQFSLDDLTRPYEWNDKEVASQLMESKFPSLVRKSQLEKLPKEDLIKEQKMGAISSKAQEEQSEDKLDEKEDAEEINEFSDNEINLCRTMEKFTFNTIIHPSQKY